MLHLLIRVFAVIQRVKMLHGSSLNLALAAFSMGKCTICSSSSSSFEDSSLSSDSSGCFFDFFLGVCAAALLLVFLFSGTGTASSWGFFFRFWFFNRLLFLSFLSLALLSSVSSRILLWFLVSGFLSRLFFYLVHHSISVLVSVFINCAT